MRTILFFFLAGTVVILILVIFAWLLFFQQKPASRPIPAIPTQIPQNINVTPRPRVNYDLKKGGELVEASKDRQSLSETGNAAKVRLKNSLRTTSGEVYSSPQVSILYVASPDLFQAEILSEDVQAAKQEAANWMVAQGFTRDDLCKLPFSFYLGTEASKNYVESGTVFNPLPEGC